MALDDYRMLAPQRQIGEPSSLENVIAQAMMSKLSPEMMQGYYLQARGQRQRHAAELGQQQATATAAGLMASDRTAAYDLLGKAITSPNAASAYLPATVLSELTPAQRQTGIDYTNYHLGEVKAKSDQARANAAYDAIKGGAQPLESEPGTGIPSRFAPTPGQPLEVVTTGMNNATTLTATGMNNDTQLGVAGINNTGANARANLTDQRMRKEGELNRQQRIDAIKLAMNGRDQQRAESLAVTSGDKMIALYEANPTNFRKTPAQRAADHSELRQNARADVFDTFGKHQTTPAIGAAVGASQLPAGADPLSGVIDAAAGGNAASGLPPDPTAAGVVAPSPAAPVTAPTATRTAVPPPTAAAKAAAITTGGDPWAPIRAKIAAVGGTIIEENKRADNPVIRYRTKDGQEARMRP